MALCKHMEKINEIRDANIEGSLYRMGFHNVISVHTDSYYREPITFDEKKGRKKREEAPNPYKHIADIASYHSHSLKLKPKSHYKPKRAKKRKNATICLA